MHVPFMHDRLRRARLLAGYHSARAAIERFGWKASTYRAHENGQNKFGARDAGAYARAFGVNPSWLLFGEQGPRLEPATDGRFDSDRKIPIRAGGADATRETACHAHFDLSLDTDDLHDLACRGDILRFAPAVDPRVLSDGDIVAVECRRETGVDILPARVSFLDGRPLFAPGRDTPAETLVGAHIVGKAIWLLRRLAL